MISNCCECGRFHSQQCDALNREQDSFHQSFLGQGIHENCPLPDVADQEEAWQHIESAPEEEYLLVWNDGPFIAKKYVSEHYGEEWFTKPDPISKNCSIINPTHWKRIKKPGEKKKYTDHPIWISVENQLPEKMRRVLIFDSNGFGVGSGRWNGQEWYFEGERDPGLNITYWQFLPEPPNTTVD